jgi:DNA polymerase/3'-5' exonuclease PolX
MSSSKQKVLDNLETLRIRDLQSGEKFSAIAYSKAIASLKKLPAISSLEDVEGVPGVGKKIKEKIKEILSTGSLAAAVKAKEDFPIELYKILLQIHGIGPFKARELITKDKITSIQDLIKRKNLLNEVQQKGLKYVLHSLERIPRDEMIMHEKMIHSYIGEATIVGSFRRGSSNSGDIDVLLKAPAILKDVAQKLIEAGYLIDILAEGTKKLMGYVKLKEGIPRRIDILVTPIQEYPYALLYFTGSEAFNIAFRKYALKKGYSLNEHGLKPVPQKEIHSEKDIFDFFNLRYKEPKQRIDGTSIESKEGSMPRLTITNFLRNKTLKKY